MSYILNALRKSDEERRKKLQSDQAQLLEETNTDPNAKFNLSSWLIIVIIFINVIVLGYLFWDKKSENNEIVANTISKRETLPDSDKSADPINENKPVELSKTEQQKSLLQNRNIASSHPKNETRLKSDSAPVKDALPKTVKTVPPGTITTPSPVPVIKSVKKFQTQPEVKTDEGRKKMTVAKLEKQEIKLFTSKKQQAEERTPVKSPEKPLLKNEGNSVNENKTETKEVQATMKEEPLPPLLRDLPYEFRRQVPTIHLNVFVYEDIPEERFVIIDMTKYKAGDLITDINIELVEILKDSIVVTYKKRTFRIERP